ncbi:queuosine precursor transporter [Helicobacter sp. 23-1045]
MQILIFSAIFALLVILSNFAVQFQIGASYLTYGALIYPLSFLLLDILSEKNSKKEVLKILRYGLIIAFIPSLFISEPRIAIASICAFIIAQPLDVHLFFFFKKTFPRLWWLRNNASTIIAQFFDTMIFFHIAFLGEKSFAICTLMALFDFFIKVLLSALNTPFFYILAIKMRTFIFKLK